jgi:arylsulfatase A
LKRHIYEGGHRVPTIISWPAVIKSGSVADTLFAQTDLMATFAAITATDLPDNAAEDSYNFLPYLRGEVKQGPRTSMVHNTNANAYAIREGEWVLVNVVPKSAPSSKGKKNAGKAELYQLKEDIGQTNDLASQHPERIKAMQELLDQTYSQGFSSPRLKK